MFLGLEAMVGPADAVARLEGVVAAEGLDCCWAQDIPEAVSPLALSAGLAEILPSLGARVGQHQVRPLIALLATYPGGVPYKWKNADIVAEPGGPADLPEEVLFSGPDAGPLQAFLDLPFSERVQCGGGALRWWRRQVSDLRARRRRRTKRPSSSRPRSRVVFSTNAGEFSGAEKSLVVLAGALRAFDLDIHCLCSREGRLSQRLREAGVEVHAAGTSLGVRDADTMLWITERLHEIGADVLHVNAGSSGTVVTAAVLQGMAIVQHLRTAQLFGYEDSVRWADRWIAVSDFVRTKALLAGVQPENATTIHNGVDPALLDATPPPPHRALAKGDDAVVLMIGRFERNKRHDTVVDATAVLREAGRNVKLRLVGQCGADRSYEASVRNRVAEKGLEPHVEFVGYCDDVQSLLSGCDAVALCSEGEALATSVLEGMAWERPCVVSDHGGFPEMVRHGETGLIVPLGDAQALAAALDDILFIHPDRGRTIAENGRAAVRRSFSAETYADRVATVYEELLRRPVR